MLIKVSGITNRFMKRIVKHCVYLLIVLFLIPAFLYFELCVVLPEVVVEWSTSYFVHLFNAHFLLLNIIGNFIYGMFTNTSISGRYLERKDNPEWDFCSVCECFRPPRAWHCSKCDICVLKRDHHCIFLAGCVGYYNHRYFIMFTFYIFVSMVYALCFNVKFVLCYIAWNRGLAIAKFILPVASVVYDCGNEITTKMAYSDVFLVAINFYVSIFSGLVFFFHAVNILKGRILYESNIDNIDVSYDKGWRLNIIEVLGIRWYYAWILPFINSPLPGNGVDWSDKQK